MFMQVPFILSLVLLSVASPLTSRGGLSSLPLSRRFNVTAGTKISDVDRARVKALQKAVVASSNGPDGVSPVPVTNSAVIYTAEVHSFRDNFQRTSVDLYPS